MGFNYGLALGTRVGARYNEFFGHVEKGETTRAGYLAMASNVLNVALFIIGCIAASGHLSQGATFGAFVGIAGGNLILPILGGNLKHRKTDIACSVVFAGVTAMLGAMAGVGHMTLQFAGKMMIVMTVGHLMMSAMIMSAHKEGAKRDLIKIGRARDAMIKQDRNRQEEAVERAGMQVMGRVPIE